ncbi:MAG: Na/Pi cotransporter family protein [Defluviitaleaceae bacterium]|nr:Na/Pi cotransporter family protein [Defluviitaleaceae bacterium]
MDFAGVILILGGLGLFLFGMRIMSSGLQLIAGNRLQGFLQKATANRFLAVIVGFIATIALNSSTASTVMTVSFINSGLMNLTQAIGVIMGANVGTTLSGHLVAIRIDAYAPIFIFIGVIMYVFFKNKKIKNIGYVILGFGVLFFGITTMGGPLRALSSLPEFQTFLVAFQNPFLAIIAGFGFTAAVQSSTAATGILIAMHVSGVPIPFETSAFIILGTNIGTSITTLIASIPANRESKRAAVFHITYDIIGSAVFGTLIFFVPSILGWFETTFTEPANQVAMFHTIYNTATLLLLLPFVGILGRMLEKIIPKEVVTIDPFYEQRLLYIDRNITRMPAAIIPNAREEILRMGKIASENLALSLEAFFEKDETKAERVLQDEKVINFLNKEIASQLVKVNSSRTSKAQAEDVSKMLGLLTDIERIGDHAENIAEYAITIKEDNLKFSNEAKTELKTLRDLTLELVFGSLRAYENKNASYYLELKIKEEKLDTLCKEYAANHIERLKDQTCNAECGVIFVDIITDLERSGDHANNIAKSIS